ncbi:hypothetical protein [Gimesia fumaroli]|uniref:Uncharacterized protein n=1 Tax=Gimesia fumaroli TaxID=2527976 RepID=A0A518I4R5_9PLAN|nr:hypothetical protein [Gimesia fumaroli]QDV48111.1 hypothetical protein Enr17x_01200 [Gimesia fumaroli]
MKCIVFSDRHRLHALFLMALVLAFITANPQHTSAGRYRVARYCPACTVPAKQNVFVTGEKANQLRVQVTGKKNNELEIYFRSRLNTQSLVGAAHLNSPHCVKLNPPGSDQDESADQSYATCFVRFQNHFVAYGIGSPGKLIKVTNDPRNFKSTDKGGVIETTPDYPVHLKWISNQVLRVAHGKGGKKVIVLRFQPNANQWQILDGETGKQEPIGTP